MINSPLGSNGSDNEPVPDAESVPDYRDLLNLTGRRYLVLGCGQGIGRQTVHALAQYGAAVVCVDSREDLATKVANEVGGIAMVADITRPDDVERVMRQSALLGDLTGVVDVVGAFVTGPIAKTSVEDWERQKSLVLDHAFYLLRLCPELLGGRPGASVTFIGSVSGLEYAPDQALYGATKAGLHHLIVSAGREFGQHGIRVNAVAPAATRTPRLERIWDEEEWQRLGALTARGTAAVPSEIAGPLLFLASDLAANVTGTVLIADGGRTGRL